MDNKKIHDNAIHDEYYQWPQLLKKHRWILWSSSVFFFLFVFLYKFSPREKIINAVHTTLSKNGLCTITYQNIDMEMLFPKLIIEDIYLDSRCSQGKLGPLNLQKVELSFGGLSFSPIGPKMKGALYLDKTPLPFAIVLGLKKQRFSIEQTDYPLMELNSLVRGVKLAGKAFINSYVDINYESGLEAFSWNINSKDLKIPHFALSFLPPTFPPMAPPINITLGALAPNIFDMNIIYNANDHIMIKKFQFGDKKSTIQVEMLGLIKENWNDFGESNLNLTFKMQFDKEFLNKNSFLNLLLPSDQGSNGTFHFKLEEALSRPSQKSIR